jgi:hypothetical protein
MSETCKLIKRRIKGQWEEKNITKILENEDENVNTCVGLHHVPVVLTE